MVTGKEKDAPKPPGLTSKERNDRRLAKIAKDPDLRDRFKAKRRLYGRLPPQPALPMDFFPKKNTRNASIDDV
jgi:hypothetical protein